MPDPDDETLMTLIQFGDEASLEMMLARWRNVLVAEARRMLGGDNESEDVVQIAFIALWNHSERYSPERGSPAAWLRCMVRSRCLDILRRRNAMPHTKPRRLHARATLSPAPETPHELRPLPPMPRKPGCGRPPKNVPVPVVVRSAARNVFVARVRWSGNRLQHIGVYKSEAEARAQAAAAVRELMAKMTTTL